MTAPNSHAPHPPQRPLPTPGRRHRAGCSVAMALALVPATSALAGVEFDPAFGGGDGVRRVQPELSASTLHVNDVAVAQDGTLWLAGSVLVGGNFDIYACRVAVGGGSHACTTVGFDLGAPNSDFGAALAIDSSGRPVIVGTATGPAGDPENRIAAIRLTTAGALDQTFGSGGRVHFPLPGAVSMADVAIQPDGRIVFVGTFHQQPFGVDDDNFLVGRLTSGGAWDESFDGDGRRVVLFNAGGSLADQARSVALAADGSIVVAGSASVGPSNSSSTDFALAVLTPSGIPDATFSGDGREVLAMTVSGPQAASGVAIDHAGRIVVAGKVQVGGEDDLVAFARLFRDGGLDGSFGVGGRALHGLGVSSITGVSQPLLAPAPAGGLVVAGRFLTGNPADSTDTYILRLQADGELDTSVGGGNGFETQSTVPSVSNPDARFYAATFLGSRLVVAGGQFAETVGFVAQLRFDELFADDFESGNTNAWSLAVGASGGPD